MQRKLEVCPFIINILEREILQILWKWFSWSVSVHHHKDSHYPHFVHLLRNVYYS